MSDPQPRFARLLPTLALAGLLLALFAGWRLFPRFQAYMAEQDCIASGRTNCVSFPTQSRP